MCITSYIFIYFLYCTCTCYMVWRCPKKWWIYPHHSMTGSPSQLLQCTRWILTDMSHSYKKYYDYVMCLLVYYHPRYISYILYVFFKCLYYTYWDFSKPTNITFGGHHVQSSAGRWWVVLRRWSSNTKIGTPTTRLRAGRERCDEAMKPWRVWLQMSDYIYTHYTYDIDYDWLQICLIIVWSAMKP